MKKYLRIFLANTIALWAVAKILEGVKFGAGWQTLALTALVLSLVNLFIKPLINLLLLPINLLTLGLFRWLANVISLYIVTWIVPEFKIFPFDFPGFSYKSIIIQPMHLEAIWVFIIASFIISLIVSFILWLMK